MSGSFFGIGTGHRIGVREGKTQRNDGEELRGKSAAVVAVYCLLHAGDGRMLRSCCELEIGQRFGIYEGGAKHKTQRQARGYDSRTNYLLCVW